MAGQTVPDGKADARPQGGQMAEYTQGELTSVWKGMVRGMAPEQLIFTALGKRDGRRSEEANPDRNGGRTSEPVVSTPWSHPQGPLLIVL